MNRRNFLKSTATAALAGTISTISKPIKSIASTEKNLNIYWGDLHTHCNITYGHGSMEDALEAAVQQLDFCAIVAHALWPDIPKDNERIAGVIDYHREAFKRVRQNWKYVQDLNAQYRKPGKFITFLSYECHNMKDGDHNVYLLNPYDTITEAVSIPDLKAKLKNKKTLVIPHHMAYIQGFRGLNWDSFEASEQTPFVEIYSRHGCSESDCSPYPMLHDMGPRSFEGTALAGLERGYKFGMIASSDQHAGYPGSYGDGRIAVFAKVLSPESLWEGFLARRVYGTTGEKILIDFRINGAIMGQELSVRGKRIIYISAEGNDFLDYIDLIKNGKCIERINAPFLPEIPTGDTIHAKVRIEWGWGRTPDYYEWNGIIELTGGRINSITPCFRGLQITSPERGNAPVGEKTMVSRLLETSEQQCTFLSYTTKNPNTLTPMTNAIILDVDMPKRSSIRAIMNGKTFEHTLGELLEGTRSHFINGWLSEAVSFHRAIPPNGFTMEKTIIDITRERETDYYYLRVREKNNQWAWSSPIWVMT